MTRISGWPTRMSSSFALVVPLLLGSSPPLAAQEAPPPETVAQEAASAEVIAQAEQEGFVRLADEVLVTGSLIPREDLSSLSPVVVVNPEEITYQGTTRVEDLISSLPAVFPGQNSTVANGASGTATVDLRALFPVRTLVLINGRRMPPGHATGFASNVAPDLNFIPPALVQRVDVLTGGASTVYGADAVAGVVNFVLDTEFEGVRGGLQYNAFQHNNNNALAREINGSAGFEYPSGGIWDSGGFGANLAVGGKFADGRGHASAYIDFRNIPALTKSQRDYFNCTIARGPDGPVCGGSSTTPQGRFISFTPDWRFNGDFVLDLSTGNTFKPNEGETYNFGTFNHIQRPDRKWSGGAFTRYTVNERFEAYAEVMFMDDYSDAQIAPTGNFGVTEVINCDNPMLSPQQRDLICTRAGFGPNDYANVVTLRRNSEGGNRTNQIRHTSFRLVGGLRGDINPAWSYDFYGLHGEVSNPESYVNDFHGGRIGDAMDVVGDPDDPSTWRCRSGNPGCAPWNIFQAGGVTQVAIDYLSLATLLISGTRTQMLNLTLTGDLERYGVALPSASEGIQLALGAEYRQEELWVNPDEARRQGLRAGSPEALEPIDGGFNVRELFVEALVPVVQDTRGAEDLALELGYRYADYNLSGGNSSYKAMVSWAPTRGLKLRAGYNRAVRAPNVRELFDPQTFGIGGFDPCENDPATGAPSATLEQCLRTGLSADQYGNVLTNPSGERLILLGGNPKLRVETADTLTAGLVWTPPSITGLSATIDYFDIDVEDTIDRLGATDIIQTCATTGDPVLCRLIHRDSAGTLWLMGGYTETTNQNIGQLGSRGLDVSVNYPLNLGGSGFMSFSFLGTYLLEESFTNPLTSYDCAGYFGNQCGLLAEWRHRFRATWQTSFDTTISLGWRFIGSTEIDDASPNPNLANPDLMESWRINGSDVIDAYHYLDLAATFAFRDGLRLTFGANNLLDEDPPFAPGQTSTGFWGTYDPLGRTIYTNLQFEF